MKFESDTPAGLVRCCRWKTPRAVRAPEAPDKSDRTSSFDCPSNRLRLIPASILPGKVFTPCLYSLLPPPRQFLLTFFFFASVIWSNECSASPPSGEQPILCQWRAGYIFSARQSVKQCFIFWSYTTCLKRNKILTFHVLAKTRKSVSWLSLEAGIISSEHSQGGGGVQYNFYL